MLILFLCFGLVALSGCNYLFEYNYITLKLYQPRHVLPCRYKLFGYFAPNAAQMVHRVPCGHYFGPKATLIFKSSFGSTWKPFLSDGFPAMVLILELFRNNHPIETGFHSEWLRYSPKGPRGPIPPKGAEGALRYPWASWGSLGSPWAHPKGSEPC